MKNPEKTPLENWIARKIGLKDDPDSISEPLARHQLEKINETIDLASRNSPFYKRLFSHDRPRPLSSLRELSRLPFTSAEDIRNDPYRFLCVSQDRIARVMTLRTSGTTNDPKRIFFTDSDLERTIDFFHHGMSTLVEPGRRVLILMPGDAPGSVGDLLVKGLARMNVRGIVHGPVRSHSTAVDAICSNKIDCLVGLPVQVLSLARSAPGSDIGPGRIESALLSADYVPSIVPSELKRIWECKVFQHYGMTESGLGGGVECEALDGCHMREADLYYEIIDPATGRPTPDGQIGEVVFTTLTRRAMPLIRYRTGDLASFIPEPCPCGSALRRMSPVRGRIDRDVRPRGSRGISMSDLDEAVFTIPHVMNYQAELVGGRHRDHLKITVRTDDGPSPSIAENVHAVISAVPRIRDTVHRGTLRVAAIAFGPPPPVATTAVKRRIIDRRRNV